MRLLKLLSGFTLGAILLPAIAGSGHDHDHGHSHSHEPVNQETAQIKATEIVAALAKRKTIDQSWTVIKASSTDKIMVQENPEWKVIFENKTIKDTTKQKLYVFLTLGGDYIAANFTGK